MDLFLHFTCWGTRCFTSPTRLPWLLYLGIVWTPGSGDSDRRRFGGVLTPRIDIQLLRRSILFTQVQTSLRLVRCLPMLRVCPGPSQDKLGDRAVEFSLVACTSVTLYVVSAAATSSLIRTDEFIVGHDMVRAHSLALPCRVLQVVRCFLGTGTT